MQTSVQQRHFRSDEVWDGGIPFLRCRVTGNSRGNPGKIDRRTSARGDCWWQKRCCMAERSTFENFGRKVDAQFGKVGPRVEDEVKRVITYLNDQVVPQVRQNSSSALRMAAEQLGRLADYLDEGRKGENTSA
jgi:hypothetical protein